MSRAGAIAAWVVACAVILTFYSRFVVPGYQGRFAMDDPMNLNYYWAPGPWQLIRGLLLFFSTYERPMGGVYYMLIYHFFGLNPLPYHVVLDALLLVNLYLIYRFVRLLSDSPLAGALTALLLTYHRVLSWIIYRPSFIYDTLCFTFFFLTLNYYIGIRSTGARLTRKQTAFLVLLSIGALDSKEMAASLPLVVLAYEAIWYGPRWRSLWSIRHWLRQEAVLAFVLGAITAVYTVGHTLGAGALTQFAAYRPTVTLRNFAQANTRFINLLFYLDETNPLSERECLLIWVALVYVAWRRRDKLLCFAAFFILLTPLPIDFIPQRGGGCLYIPLAGWAMALSTLFLALASIAKQEPPLRRVPLGFLRAALALVAAFYLWKIDTLENSYSAPALIRGSRMTWAAISQLKTLQPTVPPHTKMVFLKTPFDGWDMCFIANLTYRDRTVDVQLADHIPFTPAQIAAFDIIITWEQGRLVRLKPEPVTAAPAS